MYRRRPADVVVLKIERLEVRQPREAGQTGQPASGLGSVRLLVLRDTDLSSKSQLSLRV